MAIYKEDIADIELKSGTIHRSFLGNSIGSGDKMANRFGVRLFRGGEPVSAESSTVTGVFMAPDGNRYAISETSYPGSTGKDGNSAWVQLPEICYAVAGQFCLSIKLSGGSVEGTMRIIDGVVSETGETGAVVPTSTIPTTAEIIAAYEEAVEVIDGSVRFDASQTLSDAEAETARENIDAAGIDQVVRIDDEQNLTDAEMEQARENIGASSVLEVLKKRSISGITDLNDLYEPGWYVLNYEGSYSHTPEPSDTIGQRIVVVYPNQSGDTPTANSYRLMTYVNIYTGVNSRRLFTDGSWMEWTNEFCMNSMPGSDLDALYRNGWYVISANESGLLHSPEANGTTGQRQVYVFSQAKAGTNTYRVMFYTNQATGIVAMRIYYSSTWHEWTKLSGYNGWIENGEDLNNLFENGWYTVASASHILHSPETDDTTGQRIVVIMASSGKPGSGTQRYMIYMNKATGTVATRLFNSGSWEAWTISYSRILALTDGTDLNTLYHNGWYTAGYNHVYLNSPEAQGTIGRRIIWINGNTNKPTANSFRWMQYINIDTGVYARRLFVGGQWENWFRDSESERTRSESFVGSAIDSQGENTGENIRVMTYNVARYNNDTQSYISDQKLFNLRKAVGQINADILCVQEDMGSIDGSNKSSHKYVYLPQYPYMYNDGAWANLIYSKKHAASSGRVKYTDYGSQYRGIEYAVFEIGIKKLLVCSSHPSWNDTETGGESEEAIASRLSQYTEMFRWISGEITMTDFTTGNAVSVPDHTHVVIGMDANSATADDKANLTSLADDHDMILGNGGALGWFVTNLYKNIAIDVIAVSDNIIINNIESYGDLYPRLYSDHVPVVADLTLL